MRKPVLGLFVGAVLGVLDGLSAWAEPVARPYMASIVIGSTIKGLITGVIVGYVAQRTNSMGKGILAGLVVGLVLSYVAAISASMPEGPQYMAIMLPGAIIGVLVGIISQKYGKPTSTTDRIK